MVLVEDVEWWPIFENYRMRGNRSGPPVIRVQSPQKPVIGETHSPTIIIAMESIEQALAFAVRRFSDQNYAQSLIFYRFWFDIGQKYYQTPKDGLAASSIRSASNRHIPSDQTINAIWNSKETHLIVPGEGKLIHPTAHLIVRFTNDAESDRLLAPHNAGLQTRLCAKALREFFSDNLEAMIDNRGGANGRALVGKFCAITNLIAHCANLGYLEEPAIRNHVLQSLISYPKLYDHQAQALIILFKLAGATFGAYVDPSVVDRCFELLKDHSGSSPQDRYKPPPGSIFGASSPPRGGSYDTVKKTLIRQHRHSARLHDRQGV